MARALQLNSGVRWTTPSYQGPVVNTTEFQAMRQRLQQSDEELADFLGVSPGTVLAWIEARREVPRRYAQQIEWLAASAEREAALRDSGLPECHWMQAHVAKPLADDQDAVLKHVKAANDHVEGCPVCRAREQFIEERFGPMPPMPQSGWMRVFAWIERIPPWARPAAVGAAILGAIVSLRVAFALPVLFSNPDKLGEALLAVAAAAGAGAAGGFAYTLTRPSLRRLGRIGDYLTGIVCVFAYMGALALVAPLAFGERLIKDRAGLIVFVVVSAFFGLVVGHTWFRGQSANDAQA